MLQAGRRVVAIEVKSGRSPTALPGLAAFNQVYKSSRSLLVGGDGIPIDEFLSRPVTDWLGSERA